MTVDLIDILNSFAIFQCWMMAAFLLLSQRCKQLGNLLLAGILIALSFTLLEFELGNLGLALRYPQWVFIGSIFGFVIPSLLYLYVCSLVRLEYTFSAKHLVHLLPFFVVALYALLNYHLLDGQIQLERLTSGAFNNMFITLIIPLSGSALYVGYLAVALLEIIGYNKRLKQSQSNTDKINLAWLTVVLGVFLLLVLLGLSFQLITAFSEGYNPPIALLSYQSFILFLFINYVVLMGLKNPEIFQYQKKLLEEPQIKISYAKSTLKTSDVEDNLKRIANYFEQQKPYLNPSLTVNDVAKKLKLQAKHVSQLINENLDKHFYDLVNSYRIEHAKCLLLKDEHKAILDTAFESGFNSKSSFYTAFKKCVSCTPKQFVAKNSAKK